MFIINLPNGNGIGKSEFIKKLLEEEKKGFTLRPSLIGFPEDLKVRFIPNVEEKEEDGDQS